MGSENRNGGCREFDGVAVETTARTHRVLLVNLGTTQAPESQAVHQFLSEFLADPMVVDYPRWFWRPLLRLILRSRAAKVAEQYRSIWTEHGSPLAVGTRSIADQLRQSMEGHCEVRYAYRYGTPSLRNELEAAAHDGVAQLEIIPLFPHRTGSTTGTIEALVDAVSNELDIAGRVKLSSIEPDDSGYVLALADAWKRAVAAGGIPQHLVVSFHGIPRRYDRKEGGAYQRDCHKTYQALLARIGWPEENSTISFQSRFGPEPWLSPATAVVLEQLPTAGIRSVAVAMPGFLTEGLETIEEIGIRGRATFMRAGGQKFMTIDCVQSHPAFIGSLVEAIEGRRVHRTVQI